MLYFDFCLTFSVMGWTRSTRVQQKVKVLTGTGPERLGKARSKHGASKLDDCVFFIFLQYFSFSYPVVTGLFLYN